MIRSVANKAEQALLFRAVYIQNTDFYQNTGPRIWQLQLELAETGRLLVQQGQTLLPCPECVTLAGTKTLSVLLASVEAPLSDIHDGMVTTVGNKTTLYYLIE